MKFQRIEDICDGLKYLKVVCQAFGQRKARNQFHRVKPDGTSQGRKDVVNFYLEADGDLAFDLTRLMRDH